MRIRRPRLGQGVVAVVPDHDQAEVAAPARTPRCGCRSPAARCRAAPPASAGSARTGPGPPTARPRRASSTQRVAACAQRVDVPLIGHDRQHRAPAAARSARRPRRTGRPTARRAAPARPRGRRGLGQRGQELPAAGVDSPSPAGRPPAQRKASGAVACFALDLGVPGRHRQPQHVGAGARVARRDRVDQSADLRGEHRLGATPPGPASPACRRGRCRCGAPARTRRPAGRGTAPAPAPRAGRRRTARRTPGSRTRGPGAAPTSIGSTRAIGSCSAACRVAWSPRQV